MLQLTGRGAFTRTNLWGAGGQSVQAVQTLTSWDGTEELVNWTFGQKKTLKVRNTPGTAGGPGGRDRTLAVESRKITCFSLKNKIYPPKIFIFAYIF